MIILSRRWLESVITSTFGSPWATRQLGIRIYEFLTWLLWVGAYLLHAYYAQDFVTIVPFLIVVTLYQLLMHFFGRNPVFYTAAVQLWRAIGESLIVLFSIAYLNDWRTHLWLLLQLPVLEVARLARFRYLAFFIAGISTLPPVIYVMAYGAVDLLNYAPLWASRVGYLTIIGLAVCLLVSYINSSSRPLAFLSVAGASSNAQNWHSLAGQFCEILAAERVRLIDFKALTGQATTLADVDVTLDVKDPLPKKSVVVISPEDPTFIRLTKEGHLFIRTRMYKGEDVSWLSFDEGRNSHALAVAVHNYATGHLAGFLIAEYAAASFGNWLIGVRPHILALKDIRSSLALVFEESRNKKARELYRKIASELSLKRGAQEIVDLAVSRLAEFYGVGFVFWLSTGTVEGRGRAWPIAASWDVGGRSLGFEEVSNFYQDLASGFSVTIENHAKDDGISLTLGNSSAAYLPVLFDEEEPKGFIGIYVDSAHDHSVDRENVVNSLLASHLLPTIKLALLSSRFREQRETLDRLRIEARNLPNRLTSTPKDLLVPLARAAINIMKLNSAAWCTTSDKRENIFWLCFEPSGEDFGEISSRMESCISEAIEFNTAILERGSNFLGPFASPGPVYGATVFLPLTASIEPRCCLVLRGNRSVWWRSSDSMDIDVVAAYINLVLESATFNHLLAGELAALRELEDLARAVLEEETIDAILHQASESALRLTRANHSAVQLFRDEDRKFIYIEACSGASSSSGPLLGRAVAIGEGITGRVAANRRPEIVPDVQQEEAYLKFLPETRSELAVPLIGGKGQFLYGVLNLESLEVNHFSDLHLELTQRLATQVGLALQQAQKVARLKSINDKLEQTEDLAIIGLLYGEDIHLTSNKLGAARQLAENIQENAVSLEDAKEYAVIIRRNVQSVLDVIHEIRGSVRAPNPVQFDLHKLIRAVFDGLEKSSRIELVEELSAYPIVRGLKRQIGQVFRVIMRNSIVAMRGVGALGISTSNLREDGESYVLVRVSDSGSGIPEGTLNSLFSLDKPVGLERGLGIGLAWSRLFLNMYGGKLELERTGPQGTTMRILVPRNVDEVSKRISRSRR